MAQSGKSDGLVGEVFYPSDSVIADARLKDWDTMADKARRDPQAFWAAEAEELEWFQKWDKVLDNSKKPFFKWFVGGKVNIVHNAIDRHLKTYRKNKLALIWESEDGKLHRTFSYYAMNREVSRMANIIKAMGVRKGDRVTIYMGRIPEIVFAMLACAKIGAIHSVVFGGFSVDALQGRIEDSQSKLVITCDGSYQNGKVVELKRTVDEALKHCPSVENVIVVKRIGHEVPMEAQPRPLVSRPVALPIANGKCADRSHGCRRPALYPLHIRLHRQAQGHRAHARRLHGRHLQHPQICLRHQRRGPLLVHGRPRLGDRPLLHRLRSPAQRRDLLHVRRRPILSLSEPLVAVRRTLRHHHPLHRAHRHPRA